MYALVFWIREKQTSIVDVSAIHEEDRTAGRVGQVLWRDGARYAAQIVKVAKNLKTLEEADTKFMKEFRKVQDNNEKSTERGSQPRKSIRRTAGVKTYDKAGASSTQVARALGEKPTLPPKLASVRDSVKRSERAQEANMKSTVRAQDFAAFEANSIFHGGNSEDLSEQYKSSAKRQLDFDEQQGLNTKAQAAVNNSTFQRKKTPKKSSEDGQVPDFNGGNNRNVTGSSLDQGKKENSVKSSSIVTNASNKVGENAIDQTDCTLSSSGSDEDGSDEPVSKQESCGRCRQLTKYVNSASIQFIFGLAKFCGCHDLAEGSIANRLEQSLVEGDDVKYLKPLPVKAGYKQVELSQGSGLFLTKALKAKIIVDAQDDPFKLTRHVLGALYGNLLKQPGISAMAQGKNKCGINEDDLHNIYGFIIRNSNAKNPPGVNKKGQPKPPFTFPNFIIEVNKKLKSTSRIRTKDRKRSSKAAHPQEPLERPADQDDHPVQDVQVSVNRKDKKSNEAGLSAATAKSNSDTESELHREHNTLTFQRSPREILKKVDFTPNQAEPFTKTKSSKNDLGCSSGSQSENDSGVDDNRRMPQSRPNSRLGSTRKPEYDFAFANSVFNTTSPRQREKHQMRRKTNKYTLGSPNSSMMSPIISDNTTEGENAGSKSGCNKIHKQNTVNRPGTPLQPSTPKKDSAVPSPGAVLCTGTPSKGWHVQDDVKDSQETRSKSLQLRSVRKQNRPRLNHLSQQPAAQFTHQHSPQQHSPQLAQPYLPLHAQQISPQHANQHSPQHAYQHAPQHAQQHAPQLAHQHVPQLAHHAHHHAPRPAHQQAPQLAYQQAPQFNQQPQYMQQTPAEVVHPQPYFNHQQPPIYSHQPQYLYQPMYSNQQMFSNHLPPVNSQQVNEHSEFGSPLSDAEAVIQNLS